MAAPTKGITHLSRLSSTANSLYVEGATLSLLIGQGVAHGHCVDADRAALEEVLDQLTELLDPTDYAAACELIANHEEAGRRHDPGFEVCGICSSADDVTDDDAPTLTGFPEHTYGLLGDLDEDMELGRGFDAMIESNGW